MSLRFLTSGESHGPALLAILEGMPAGLPLRAERIDLDLARRQKGFGAGPRICIGAQFAMQEAVIALAVLLSRFRFETLPETNPWPVQKLTTQPQGGLPMRVTQR